MQMFKVMSDSILPVEVSRVNDDSVWEVMLNGAEVRKLRVPKTDKQPCFFDSLSEAKAHLVERAQAGVAVAQARLDRAQARLRQLVGE